jgi:phosphoglucosamine mutase
MKKLFGTDGIRGVAGASPLTLEEVRILGICAGRVLKRKHSKEKIRVVIVRDTRRSGPGLNQALSQGLIQEGIDVYNVGVLNTPSVAYLVKAHRFHSGVVISASHNPPKFNGIKFFTSHSRKWPDEWENEVDILFHRFIKGGFSKIQFSKNGRSGRLINAVSLAQDYVDFLINTLPKPRNLSGLKIALDCSHGANYQVAPYVLKTLGAKIFVLANRPNGNNINVGCGSQHTEKLARVVRKNKCHMGVAFDGDGDRVIFVDERGREIDGDYILALLAKEFLKSKTLKNRKTVITVMSNLGLKKALSKMGIRPVITPVGDRHVSYAMRHTKTVLGGEQSGHIILGKYLPTGDGLLTALHVLAVVRRTEKPFSQLVGFMKKFPQVLHNLTVKEKIPLERINGMMDKMNDIEKTLGDDGRLLVRYSGTEPLLRIMLEGPHEGQIKSFAEDLAKSVLKSQKT